MKLLNLCCGNVRPASTETVEWVNVDNLHATILPGTPERENLDKEPNYMNCNVTGISFDGTELIPAEWAGTFDGIIASHCFEHWDCQDGAYVMKQCRCLLKPGGILVVSVPDASYFRKVYTQDTPETAQELFGEPIHLPDGETTFFGYGLWNRYHKAILTEDSLWAYFMRAGFKEPTRYTADVIRMILEDEAYWGITKPLLEQLNRIPFSLVMVAVKE